VFSFPLNKDQRNEKPGKLAWDSELRSQAGRAAYLYLSRKKEEVGSGVENKCMVIDRTK